MHLKNAAKEIKADWHSASEHLKGDERYVAQAKARLSDRRAAHAEELADLRKQHAAAEAALKADHKAEKAVLANRQRYYAKKFVKRLLSAAGADAKAAAKALFAYTIQWPAALLGLLIVFVGSLFFYISDGRKGFKSFWDGVSR